VPHGIDETRLLRNLDLPVPAPITEHYAFPSADGKRPFAKQVLTAAQMVMNRHNYVLNGMGTGKTKACLWAFDYLRSEGKANRMLVVAPLSTLDFTWAREVFHTLPHLKVVVLSGSADRRRRLLNEKADVFIINHDGVKVILPELLQRLDIDVICFDEAAAYRNARALRSKMARKLAEKRKYIWGMTGSPTPSAPTDAFGLAWLVTPETAPRSFVQFRQDTMVNVSQFRWVPRRDAADTVSKVLQPATRYTLDEIVELPPVIYREIEVPIGVRQRKVYDALREHASALLREGTITAANGGVVFTKLLQASIGWVYGDEDRKIFALDNDDRLDALMDIIEASERKVIVFSPFKSATAGISAALKGEKIEFAEVTGDTTSKERAQIFSMFQNTEKYRVLNAHPECMSHGLTLTAADTIVWFGPVVKLETFEQANARITRVGQAHKQQVIKLVGTPVERMVYRKLEAKQELQASVLELLAELTRG
jgi:SNF2 family DNA or RNA helicase